MTNVAEVPAEVFPNKKPIADLPSLREGNFSNGYNPKELLGDGLNTLSGNLVLNGIPSAQQKELKGSNYTKSELETTKTFDTLDRTRMLIRSFYESEPPRANGENRIVHIDKMEKILENTLNEVSPGLRIATYIHDIVDRAFYCEDCEESERNLEVLKQILSNIEDPAERNYALGTALSSCEYENEAKKWREKLKATFDDNIQNDPDMDYLYKRIREVDAKDGVYNLQKNIAAALNDSTHKIDEEMRNFQYPASPVESNLEMLQLHDIEGLAIKAAEIIANSQAEYAEKPVVNWEYAQELVSFYGPLLEFAGMSKLASECNSEAYWYFYDNPELKAEATRIYENAVNSGIQTELTEYLQNALLSMNIPFKKIESRSKTKGSILKKLSTNPNYRQLSNIPDAVGIRIVLDNNVEPAEILEFSKIISQIVPEFRNEYQSRTFHSADKPIDCVFEGLDTDTNLLEDDFREKVKIGLPKRKGQYQRCHMDFVFSPDTESTTKGKTGIELQLMREKDEDEYNYGPSAHPYYKQKYGLGETGRLASAYFNGVEFTPEEKEAYTEKYLQIVERNREPLIYINRRTEYFSKNPLSYKLTDEAYGLIEKLRDAYGLENYIEINSETRNKSLLVLEP